MATFAELISAVHDPANGVFAAEHTRIRAEVVLQDVAEFRTVRVVEAPSGGTEVRQRETKVFVGFPGTAQEYAIAAGPLRPSDVVDRFAAARALILTWADAASHQLMKLELAPVSEAWDATVVTSGDVEETWRHRLNPAGDALLPAVLLRSAAQAGAEAPVR